MKKLIIFILIFTAMTAKAQIGDRRNDLSIGAGSGFVMSNIGFTPKVNQKMHTGMMGGVAIRYVCEKYFKSICSIYAEINYARIGWTEDIINNNDAPVINPVTGIAEKYSRHMDYIQIPMFANLGWGKEDKGFQFFFRAGPQVGFCISESTESNFNFADRNMTDRSNKVVAQDTMKIENKFDYGIAAGLGVEYTVPKVGHFLLEGRYYYGLGNIYGNSNKDYFGKSNFGNIVIKLTYLFDIIKTKSNN